MDTFLPSGGGINFSEIGGCKITDYNLCMGYTNFRRIFKDYTGFSPAKYIKLVRMNHVKEALTNTNLPVNQIAFDAGYENEDYFFTAFRQHTGMTPLEYRSFTQGK